MKLFNKLIKVELARRDGGTADADTEGPRFMGRLGSEQEKFMNTFKVRLLHVIPLVVLAVSNLAYAQTSSQFGNAEYGVNQAVLKRAAVARQPSSNISTATFELAAMTPAQRRAASDA